MINNINIVINIHKLYKYNNKRCINACCGHCISNIAIKISMTSNDQWIGFLVTQRFKWIAEKPTRMDTYEFVSLL